MTTNIGAAVSLSPPRGKALANRLDRLLRVSVRPGNQLTLSLKLTVLLFLLYGPSEPYSRVPVQVSAGAMILFPGLLRSRLLWWCLLSASVIGNGWHWYAIDNHKYLMTYWLAACLVALYVEDTGAVLRRTAQYLAGVVFACAALWKLMAGQFIDGSFLYYTLFTDSRLTRMAAALTGSTSDDIGSIADAIGFAGSVGQLDASVVLPDSSVVYGVALMMSVVGLTLEAFLAAVFLIPSTRLARVRTNGLAAFVLVTYFMLPVFPFAVALMILGFAQTMPADGLSRLKLLILLACMHLATIPWQSVLLSD